MEEEKQAARINEGNEQPQNSDEEMLGVNRERAAQNEMEVMMAEQERQLAEENRLRQRARNLMLAAVSNNGSDYLT